MNKKITKISNFISLFASSSTLICCALPALLVMIGAGATVVSLTTLFPQLIWLSTHKIKLFIIAAILLMISIYLDYRNNNISCAPTKEQTCKSTRSKSKIILIISCIIYCIGVVITFILPFINLSSN